MCPKIVNIMASFIGCLTELAASNEYKGPAKVRKARMAILPPGNRTQHLVIYRCLNILLSYHH